MTYSIRLSEEEKGIGKTNSTFMRSIFVLVIFILFIPSAIALKTSIKGTASGAENLQIRLYTWDDFITYKEILLENTDIDSAGNFNITINMHKGEVIMGFFRIMNYQSSEIFLCAGKDYEIKLDTFDYKDPNRIYIPFMSKIELNYQFSNLDSTDLNYLISSFNIKLNEFIIKTLNISSTDHRQVIKRQPRSKIDSFARAISKEYAQINNNYFNIYVEYAIAEMHMGMQSSSKERLFNNYFYKKSIHYENIQYMNFFNQFFSDFIIGISTKIAPSDIYINTIERTNLYGLIDSLGKDPMLKNELLREAVLLLNMKDWYSNLLFNKDKLLKLMKEYARYSKFDIQTRIAKNMIFLLSRFHKGNIAPDFTFKDIDGNYFNNDSLKEKATYMIFFSTWSKACLSELLALNKLATNWSDSIRFVGISMDNEPLKLYYFIQDHKFNYPIYHFDNNYMLAEDLSLQSFPHAMLLDNKGRYITHTAYLPSEGIHEYFQLLYSPPKEKDLDIGN